MKFSFGVGQILMFAKLGECCIGAVDAVDDLFFLVSKEI
jgi:hypothetical protein